MGVLYGIASAGFAAAAAYLAMTQSADFALAVALLIFGSILYGFLTIGELM